MINQEEYEILKGLDEEWKWIIRDKGSSNVYTYEEKPRKSLFADWWIAGGWSTRKKMTDKDLFQFVQWEDEEPYNIAELIEEYEYSTEHVSHVVNERVKALGKAWSESEETEVKKDKERAQLNKEHPLVKEDEDMEKAEELCQGDHDPVHRPAHYMQGHIETIDKIKLLLTPEEYLGYLKGNVIKYDRAPFKGNMGQDYDKQKVYYDWALKDFGDVAKENSNEEGGQ